MHIKIIYKNIYECYAFITADIISCVEFNHDGDLLATGDKGGRVVIFQRDPIVSIIQINRHIIKTFSVYSHDIHIIQ